MTKVAVQGMNSGMSVGDDKIRIKHTTPLFPDKREVTLDIHDLQAVAYKEAHVLINGLLKLIPKGDNPILYQTASLHQIGKDKLAIVLRTFENTSPKDVEHFYNYIVGCPNQIKATENGQL